jgi:hypothetical protein
MIIPPHIQKQYELLLEPCPRIVELFNLARSVPVEDGIVSAPLEPAHQNNLNNALIDIRSYLGDPPDSNDDRAFGDRHDQLCNIIETELEEDLENLTELVESLYEQDMICLANIMEILNFI